MGSLFGQTINPSPPINVFDQYAREPQSTGAEFLTGLANSAMNWSPTGWGTLKGLQGYQGPLSPDINQTLLPNVYGNWQPWNAGTEYAANYVGGPQAGQMNPAFQQAMGNMQNYGTIGGYPGQLIHGMAQYGGTGGPGNYAMSNLLQYGAPSAAGQGLVNVANTGVNGSWGNPLQSMAYGGQTGAYNYLAPFLQRGAQPYRSA